MATTSYGTPYVVSADLVSGYPSTSLSLADRVDDISFKGNGINNQTGTTYTLDILDAGKTVTLSNSSAVTVTIPTNTAEAIEIGSIVRFNNKGAGTVTIQPDGGVTLNGGNLTLPQFASVQIVKLDTDTWGQATAPTPGLVHIASSSFSAASAVNMNNCFTSTYENYRVILNIQGDASRDIAWRFRASGSDNTTANYEGVIWRLSPVAPSSNVAAFYDSAATTVTIFRVDTDRGGISIDVAGPQVARKTRATILANSSWSGVATTMLQYGAFGFAATTQFDGFSVYPTAGNITGDLRVYGYRNS